jgi:hypothetical protein
MNRISVFVAAAMLSAGSAVAQTAPTPASTPSSKAATQASPQQSAQAQSQSAQNRSAQNANASETNTSQTRPDANYAHPSGQDSHAGNKPKSTKLASANSKKGTGATVENRGTKTADQSKSVQELSNRNGYGGAGGRNRDPGTACSTARPTKDRGVDCGLSGDSATLGKVVTKPR